MDEFQKFPPAASLGELGFYRFSGILPIIYGEPKLLKIALPGTILVDA